MEDIEFACFFERIQKSLNIKIDSDIVSHIYDSYCQTYETYGMFELYGILKHNNVKVDVDTMNWYKLFDKIKEQKIDIQPKHILDGSCEPPWYLMRDRDDVFSITLTYPKFEIVRDDVIIMPDGFRYAINEIYLMNDEIYSTDDDEAIRNDCMVCLENIDTMEYRDMKARDFLFVLDCDEGIQFVESNWLDYINTRYK